MCTIYRTTTADSTWSESPLLHVIRRLFCILQRSTDECESNAWEKHLHPFLAADRDAFFDNFAALQGLYIAFDLVTLGAVLYLFRDVIKSEERVKLIASRGGRTTTHR